MRNSAVAFTLCTVLLFSCGRLPTEPAATPMQLGRWGGTDVELIVTADGAVFTLTRCLRGYMGRPVLDAAGHFRLDAAMESMFGPPPQPPFPHAIVTGRLNGDVLTFTATYDDGHVVGPFTATFNGEGPRFFPCPP
jgi:hypothetical protein